MKKKAFIALVNVHLTIASKQQFDMARLRWIYWSIERNVRQNEDDLEDSRRHDFWRWKISRTLIWKSDNSHRRDTRSLFNMALHNSPVFFQEFGSDSLILWFYRSTLRRIIPARETRGGAAINTACYASRCREIKQLRT